MADERVKRKLSAILSADVAGYSRLMGEDEVSTVRTLEAYRKVMSDLIEQFRGRVVDSPGDNLLSEFSSVVDAVQCAVEIHEVIRAKNEELPEDRRMLFRIGVNLGDVIEEGDRIYGDGVNIAARLEGLAEAGGICISGSAHEQIKNKLALGYEYIGEHTVKNIAEPLKVYRVPMGPKVAMSKEGDEKGSTLKKWRWTVLGAAGAIIIIIAAATVWNFYLSGPSVEPDQAPVTSEVKEALKSIAVLPFVNLSSDPEQEYFVDGLSEEILNGLCQIPDLTVIARTSSFSFKGTTKTIQEIASVLDVDHILEGSVRKYGNSIRITAQLIKVDDESHLWSETYDMELKELSL
jgi:TolB-like protein/class 3 adenylate cyclase